MKYLLRASSIDPRSGERKPLSLSGATEYKSMAAAQRGAESFLRELRASIPNHHPSVWIESAKSSPFRFEAQRDTDEQLVTRESDGERFWWIPSTGVLRRWGARVDDVISRQATSAAAVRKLLRTKANPMKKTRRTKCNPVDSTHLHLIRVDYVGPTNTRGSRVKLTSLRFPKSTYSTGFDSVYNSTLDQADDILKGMGYTVAAHGELPRGFIVGVRQFEPLPKKGGTIAKRNPGGNIEWTEVRRRNLPVSARGGSFTAGGKLVYWGSQDAAEAQRWLSLRAKGLGGRGASALSARLGPTRRNPFRRAATALVSYVDAGRRFYAVVIGRKVGWSTSHAQATPLTLSNARGLKSLMAQRGYSVDITPA